MPPCSESPRWFPLGAAQRAVWYDVAREAPRSAYLLGLVGTIDVAIDAEIARQATVLLMARHEALRLRIDETTPRQRLEPAPAPPFASIDLATEADPRAAFGAHVERALATGFALGDTSLFRLDLVRCGPRATSLLLLCHHLIADSASVGIAVGQWLALYDSLADETVGELPPASRFEPRIDADLAYAASPAYAAALASGVQRFAVAPEPLFAARAVADHDAAPRGNTPERRSIAGDAYARLHERCTATGSTLQRTLVAVLGIALGCRRNRSELAIGVASHGRDAGERAVIGMLAGVVAIRCTLEPNATVGEAAERIGRVLDEDLRHHRLPIDDLMRALGRREPLFDVVFSLQPAAWDGGAAHVAGAPWRFTIVRGPEASALTVFARERAGGAGLDLEFVSDPTRVEDAETSRIADVFERCLAAWRDAPGTLLSALDPLGQDERALIVGPWRGAAGAAPPGTIPSLIAEQIARTPVALAAIGAVETLTFAELDRRADALARGLAARGVAAESVVGVFLERSPACVVAALGVMRAGGVYLPLDPAYPQARLDFMVRDARAVLVLDDPAGPRWPHADRLALGEASAPSDAGETLAGPQPAGLAYITYTSGSTGRPKGVAIPHRAAVNLAFARRAYDPLEPGDRVLASVSVGFDASIGQLLLPLIAGATVVIAPDLRLLDPADFWAFVVDFGVTHISCVPSFVASIVAAAPAEVPVRRLLLGGERLRGGLVRQVRAALPQAAIVNVYGPTETCIEATCHPVLEPDPPSDVPIGRPLLNVTAAIVDAAGRPTGIGVPGELLVGGAGVARGYLGPTALTAQRFIADPIVAEERVYRTGDRAAWRADGTIAFLGRTDAQIKIRGFRVEPGEVEAALTAHDAVAQAAVVLRDGRLAGYVVPRSGVAFDPGAVRAALSERLPDYMVPATLTALTALPLTPNGKLDERALPAAGSRRVERAPRSDTERRVMHIVGDMLGRSDAGPDDDFFALGGHSLLATQLVTRLYAEFGVVVPLRAVFADATIAGLARAVDAAGGPDGAAPPVPLPRPRAIPVSAAQERFWFLDGLTPGAYNIALAFAVDGPFDAAAADEALRDIVHRHEALRTTLGFGEEAAHQTTLPVDRFAPRRVRLGATDDVAAYVAKCAARPFAVMHDVPIRAEIVTLTPTRTILAVVVHHMAFDGWSAGVFLDEFARLYEGFARGEPAVLPPPRWQYADVAVWQRAHETPAGIAFWEDFLADAPLLRLPGKDAPVPGVPSVAAVETMAIAAAAPLRARARDAGASLFMVLHAAFALALQRSTGQEDLVIGTAVANRTVHEWNASIGCFINTLALRTTVASGETFATVLERTRAADRAAFAHQDVPFGRVAAALRRAGKPAGEALVRALLIFQNAPMPDPVIAGLTVRALALPVTHLHADLSLEVREGVDGVLFCEATYNASLFEPVPIRRLLMEMSAILADAAPLAR